jgi:hypothetical protein
MAEQLNTFNETPETPEGHDEAMLAKAEQLEQNNDPSRPDWLPEKFKSAEDMAQAYSELEKKLGSKQEDQTTKAEEVNEPTPDADATEVVDVLDKAGLDFDVFQQEYNENGGLSDDAYKALEESGFPKSLVDSWIAGQEALAQDMTQSVYQTVGGQEQYAEMVQWAAQSLPPAEVEAFNQAIETGDANIVSFAVQGLHARYRSEAGATPKLVKGEASPTSSGAFNSAAELTAAMRDPRYHNDPAYRQTVAEKLARSNVF